jgi:hypothetical protein
MEDKFMDSDNSKLLSLIDEWITANGKGKTYENVVLELLNGNSFLFVQTFDRQVKETRTFVSDKNTELEFGIWEIEGKKYFGAFTDLNLLTKWLKVRSSSVQLHSKTLLEMADKTQVDGIVINSSYRNMFVVFRNDKVELKNGL